jgi:hypothetical protein
MPERIQLQRTKGWRKPANTVVVARPTKHGNPFRVVQWGSFWGVLRPFRLGDTETMVRGFAAGDLHDTPAKARQRAVDLFCEAVDDGRIQVDLEHLRGKNLGCWCPLDQACHADVLLERANRP